jgi:hypothetical protein
MRHCAGPDRWRGSRRSGPPHKLSSSSPLNSETCLIANFSDDNIITLPSLPSLPGVFSPARNGAHFLLVARRGHLRGREISGHLLKKGTARSNVQHSQDILLGMAVRREVFNVVGPQLS